MKIVLVEAAAGRVAEGKALRAVVPRSGHAVWASLPDRADPVGLLEEQARTRIAELVPIRHGRMLVSPFAFLRGSAIVMAADLARTPASGIRVHCCGDAHLANFGVYATNVVFLARDLSWRATALPIPEVAPVIRAR